MGKSSSADLRVRIYGEIEQGQTCRAAARRYGVAPSTVVRLAQRKARTGSLAPARQGRPVGSGSLAAHVAALIGWVEAEGDFTMTCGKPSDQSATYTLPTNAGTISNTMDMSQIKGSML